MPVVDLGTERPGAGPSDAADIEEPEIVERSMVDPRDGTVISLKPGDTMLVRFSFRNDQRNQRMYVLEEDRSLEQGWLVFVQDQVNITANGTGELSVRVTPPASAAPGTYPFKLSTGLQGATLNPCNLLLEVQPTPAVKLTTKQALVKQGPFGRTVDFALTAESAGNADTSFRIAVKDPTVEPAQKGEAQKPDDIYETNEWRYLFDKEFETLESKAVNRPPTPVPVRVRLLRKGIWWFGFKETHKAVVKAVPVTDPANGQKPVNEVELTAVRWRLLPIPGFLAVPLLALMFIALASKPEGLTVLNSRVGQDAERQVTHYIVQMTDETKGWKQGKPKVSMEAVLRWRAPWYALLKVHGPDGSRTLMGGRKEYRIPVEVPANDYGKDKVYTYEVSSFVLPFRKEAVAIRLVPIRTDMQLTFSGVDNSQEGPPVEAEVLGTGTERKKVTGWEVPVEVPVGGDRPKVFHLVNETPSYDKLEIVLWPLEPIPAPYKLGEGDLSRDPPYTIQGGGRLKVVVRVDPGAEPVEKEWKFLTTDARREVLTLRLRPVME
jgi:hypothetical protein